MSEWKPLPEHPEPPKGPATGPLFELRAAHAIQGMDGNWNVSEYMRGYYNGLELALSYFERREPDFRDAPEGEEQ